MAMDRFLIAPISEGLDKSLKPFLIADDAWAELNNAYLFRGRLRKRFGSTYTGTTAQESQCRIFLGNTVAGVLDGSLVGPGNFFDAVYPGQFAVGQTFSIGPVIFTVINETAGAQAMLRSDNSGELATFDCSTGNYQLTCAAQAAVPVYFYPSAPIMGLTQFATGQVNNEPAYAFDEYFCYAYNGGWNWVGPTQGFQWHGTDTNFFWTTSWVNIDASQRVLFVSNFQVTNPNGAIVATDDPLWIYTNGVWGKFKPQFLPQGTDVTLNQTPYIATARIILPFKDRLILLNTIETISAGGLSNPQGVQTTNVAHPNRCRFCHNGSPFSTNAWYEPNQRDAAGNNADGGGWLDAPTDEAIMSAEFIKDRLIVYFERSTWELVYTGNQVLPFIWQKINTELGSEGTFSTVPFDKVVLTVGATGITACSGAAVERIDNKIPDEVFKINDKIAGISRIQGIRDYFTEMVYWTFPPCNANATSHFPNRVLVYNYANGAFAFNDDTITALGYFEQQTGMTWANSFPLTWEQADFEWDSGVIQPQFRQVIGGNQHGFIFNLMPDIPTNASVLSITNIVTILGLVEVVIVNHNLANGDYIQINDPINSSNLNGGIWGVEVIDANTVALSPIPNDPFDIFTGPYVGGATAARVAKITVTSKQWNPYLGRAQNFYLSHIDFNVQRTASGQLSLMFYTDSTGFDLAQQAIDNGVATGTYVLETSPYTLIPYEKLQDRLWHQIYFQGEGSSVQITLTMNEDQMTNPAIVSSPFELDALVLHTTPTRNRLV